MTWVYPDAGGLQYHRRFTVHGGILLPLFCNHTVEEQGGPVVGWLIETVKVPEEGDEGRKSMVSRLVDDKHRWMVLLKILGSNCGTDSNFFYS